MSLRGQVARVGQGSGFSVAVLWQTLWNAPYSGQMGHELFWACCCGGCPAIGCTCNSRFGFRSSLRASQIKSPKPRHDVISQTLRQLVPPEREDKQFSDQPCHN